VRYRAQPSSTPLVRQHAAQPVAARSSLDEVTHVEPSAAALLSGRAMLLNVAYRLLGTVSDAEDAVQETYLRWYALSGEERTEIRSPQAWLVRVATRICLDSLRSARHRRERYVGPWLPEPIPGRDRLITGSALSTDPADRITLDESVTMAILVILDTLTPAQRVAFVLHDVFGFPFDEVADVLDRSTAACRALAGAARQRIESGRSRAAKPSQHEETVNEFKAAFLLGDVARLIALMEPEVIVLSDGGGEVRAALRPIFGADKAARYLAGIHRLASDKRIDTTDINGRTGLVIHDVCAPYCVANFDIVDGKIQHMWMMFCPTKLRLWR
jgi:RNA polymerase sigma factor (sigma-70 family)